jgi:hypothetical protein
VSGDSLVFGPPLTTQQTFEAALAKFDSALAHPGLSQDDGTITNLALVGRARTLVDLGRFDEAAAAAADVPTDFQYVSEHAETPLQIQNAIWSYTNQGLWSVARTASPIPGWTTRRPSGRCRSTPMPTPRSWWPTASRRG